MGNTFRAVQVVVCLLVALAAFAAGFVMLHAGKAIVPPEQRAAGPAEAAPWLAAAVEVDAAKAAAEARPSAKIPSVRVEGTPPAGVAIPPLTGDKARTFPGPQTLANKPFAVSGAPDKSMWKVKTMFGLPKPHKLNAKEKAALKLLGGARDEPQFKFSSMELEDGSRIPGTPLLESKDVKQRVLGKVKDMGIADGFEAAILELAPHNLNNLILPVDKTPPWTELQSILGAADSSSEGDLWFTETKVRVNAYYRITWHRYGWLYFGVGKDLVRAIKADMRHAEIVAAETYPGGRSPPDPARVAERKKKEKPKGPREQNALRLLGQAVDVRVATRKSLKPDPKLNALVTGANELAGKDLYPHMIETARKLKESRQSDYLLVTPSNTITLDELNKVMGVTSMTNTDATTLPGKTLTWHRHFWLEFGVADGQVKKVRIHCSVMPSTGP